MRFHILFLSLVITACSTREPVESLGDYAVPFDLNEKIYTYVELPDYDTITHHFKFTTDQQDQLLTEVIYVNGGISSERFYRISASGKQLEKEYYYEYPGPTANEFEKILADIDTYEAIDDGKKYDGIKVKLSVTNSIGFRTTFVEEDTYLGDTTILWQNTLYPAIKFQYTSSRKTVLKYLPFVGTPSSHTGNSYYAKGIGLIRNEYTEDSVFYSKRLVSIQQVE